MERISILIFASVWICRNLGRKKQLKKEKRNLKVKDPLDENKRKGGGLIEKYRIMER